MKRALNKVGLREISVPQSVFFFSNLKMAVQARHPNVLYAQDKTKVYLTVDLQDALNPDISTTTESVKFKCQVNSITYEFEINLYGKVVENVFWANFRAGAPRLPTERWNCQL